MSHPGAAAPSHAGVVAYRRTRGTPEFLLVEASSTPGDWVCPKGHLERGESAREAAVRELREEAGVEGRLGSFLGTQAFLAKGEPVRVAWWLLESVLEMPSPEGRRTRWCTLPDALSIVRHEEQRDLLRSAAERVEAGG